MSRLLTALNRFPFPRPSQLGVVTNNCQDDGGNKVDGAVADLETDDIRGDCALSLDGEDLGGVAGIDRDGDGDGDGVACLLGLINLPRSSFSC